MALGGCASADRAPAVCRVAVARPGGSGCAGNGGDPRFEVRGRHPVGVIGNEIERRASGSAGERLTAPRIDPAEGAQCGFTAAPGAQLSARRQGLQRARSRNTSEAKTRPAKSERQYDRRHRSLASRIVRGGKILSRQIEGRAQATMMAKAEASTRSRKAAPAAAAMGA